ncbi:MAG: condensation domain-containing protein, partial [Cyclobacteriaceae bacterium]
MNSSQETIELLKLIRQSNHRLYLDKDDNLRLDVFKGGLPKELRERIKSSKDELISYLKENSRFKPIPNTPEKASYCASSSQTRLYFLHEFDKTSSAYNMPHVMQLKGNLEFNKLENVLERLIQHHSSLRT